MKRTMFALFPRTLIETWALEYVFYQKYSGCCDMAKVLCILYALGASSISIKHYTDMSMLLDYVIQHGIDDAHRQWCTLPYTMGDCHQVLVPSTMTMEYMFPFHQWCNSCCCRVPIRVAE